MISWSASLETGHPVIDADHRTIIDHLNLLEAALQKGASPQELEEFIVFLDDYTRGHFGREESYFAQVRCPASGENCAAHALLRNFLDEWRQERMTTGVTQELALKVYITTSKWICSHIFSVDSKVRSCLPRPSPAGSGTVIKPGFPVSG